MAGLLQVKDALHLIWEYALTRLGFNAQWRTHLCAILVLSPSHSVDEVQVLSVPWTPWLLQ